MTCCPALVRCLTGFCQCGATAPDAKFRLAFEPSLCFYPSGARVVWLVPDWEGIHLTKDRECRSPRHCRSRALQRDVFVGCGVGEAGDQLETGLADSWSDAIEEAQEPNRRVDRPFVDEPLHLLEDCCAFFVVELDRLLLEQLVDVGVTAIGVSAALDIERFHSGRRIAERTTAAVDDV